MIAQTPSTVDLSNGVFDLSSTTVEWANDAVIRLRRDIAQWRAFPVFGGTADADDDPPPWAGEGPSIPDVTGRSALNAALAYAKAGMYVVPTSPTDVKNPGSILGNKWQDQSSADPEQIRAWWTAHPDAGIAWDVGRSGAVAFDFDVDRDDQPADTPDDVWSALQTGAIHITRRPGCGKDARAHYVFACQPDEFGNSAGGFGRWGQVRCSNGVIILAPTPHPDAKTKDGFYSWREIGDLPPLPDVLHALLSAAAEHDDPKTPAELITFLAAHTGNDAPNGLQGHLTTFTRAVERGQSRHDEMTKVMAWAFREAIIGRFPARTAYDALKMAFYRAKPETKGTGEFDRIARWAAAQAETADPSHTHSRVNRNAFADPLDSVRADLAEFWSSSGQLTDLRNFAHARFVGPLSMLGNTLARVVSAIPPEVVLPPTVGGVASLNMFVALVGRSGDSKSASMRASADWLRVAPDYGPTKPGSGEGLAKCFATKAKAIGGGFNQVGKQWSVLAQITEVDTLAATGGRGGATIMSTLREGWSGERLGLDYAGEDKRIVLMDNRYRLCLSLGVQPLRAAPLFDDADGGTPQRFVWFPTTDPDIPEVEPPEPPRIDLGRWEPNANPLSDQDMIRNGALATPVDPSEFDILVIPTVASEEVKATQRAIRRGIANVDPLDGHRLLVQLKIAAALMALEGRRHEVAEIDWQRAKVMMAVSDLTRQMVLDQLASKARESNLARGRAEGEREIVKTDVIAEERQRVFKMAERICEALKAENGQTVSSLRKRLASGNRNRDVFDKAVPMAVDNGMVRSEDFTARNGQDSTRLWVAT